MRKCWNALQCSTNKYILSLMQKLKIKPCIFSHCPTLPIHFSTVPNSWPSVKSLCDFGLNLEKGDWSSIRGSSTWSQKDVSSCLRCTVSVSPLIGWINKSSGDHVATAFSQTSHLRSVRLGRRAGSCLFPQVSGQICLFKHLKGESDQICVCDSQATSALPSARVCFGLVSNPWQLNDIN